MSTAAVRAAIAAAREGIDWQRPCLLWVADYLLAETGQDFASLWRDVFPSAVGAEDARRLAMRELRSLALHGKGECLVERAIDNEARRYCWREADGPRQGAIMIGVFRDGAENGSPAIFDGQGRWVLARLGGAALSTGAVPDRIWEIVA